MASSEVNVRTQKSEERNRNQSGTNLTLEPLQCAKKIKTQSILINEAFLLGIKGWGMLNS